VRQEGRAIALAAACFLAGAAFGAIGMAVDPDAWIYLVPEEYQGHDPQARIERDSDLVLPADQEAAFSAKLFTHNIQVTILVFAVGIFGGLLTAALLFFNGIALGSIWWIYFSSGKQLFFWAWILPHGSLELSSIFIAGGAGFVLGRALLAPGRLTRRSAIKKAGADAVKLVLGTAPVLVMAGIIEGSISQWHGEVVSPELKLAVAFVAFFLLWTYLLMAGRPSASLAPDT